MRLRRTAAIALRQFYLMRGSPARVVPVFTWAAIDIVLWGFITRYLNSVASPGFNFVPSILGAVLLWDLLTRVLHGVTMAFMEDVWSRNFLNFFATPLSTWDYLAGLVLSSIGTSLITLVVILVLATVLFGLSFFAYGAMLIPFLLVLFLFGIAMGIGGAALVLRFGPASEWFIWPIPALISPLAAVYYPVATLPRAMQYAARLIPPSYVFEGMRAIVARREVPGDQLALGVVLAAIDVLLACWIFVRVYRSAVRTGLIARYSAESVS